MTTFLFWNLNRKSLWQEVATVSRDHDVDVIILAEMDRTDLPSLSQALNTDNSRSYTVPTGWNQKVLCLVRGTPDAVVSVRDHLGTAIRILNMPAALRLLVVGVHLPSKLFVKPSSQAAHAREVAELVREARRQNNIEHTLIVGDFNMDPFEPGMVEANSFHGVMTAAIARQGTRRVLGVDWPMYYNPMWSRLGDGPPGPSGTYWYRGSDYLCYFWNTFDQVLVSAELVDRFPLDRLTVVDSVGGVPLLTDRGTIDPSMSDHLPIVFAVETESWRQSHERGPMG